MRQAGYIESMPGIHYVHRDSPAMAGLVNELMPHEEGLLQEYRCCAAVG